MLYMNGSNFIRKIPAIRLAAYLFCTAMFFIMVSLTVTQAITGNLNEPISVMTGNCILWLTPFAFRAIFKDNIGDTVYLFAYLFCFFASFLGSIMDFYDIFWWYDILMHTLFGYIGAIIGLFLACKLADIKNLSPIFVVCFSFAVSLMFAALCEVFEFSGDMLFNNDAQGSPVVLPDGQIIRDVADSMEDIICIYAGR